MKRLFLLLLPLLMAACVQEKPLISNPERLNDIEKMLKIQKALTGNAQLPIWTVLDNPTSKNEEQALKFLYAYMPLSDLADYSPEFMKANVRQSLVARQEALWGTTLPEDEFLHFVLPLRVNNENLDSFRLVYYAEIKARIEGMPMKEAALEINHWCHEKVNYRGTDSRTSAPMSTIRKGFGRCGEESTFTVTAMRTAGIPARQVYTPRWAHTDDNHAWVEVWIDGKWHYLGACEPDAELDRGWFSEPAQRTMLVHTRCYGRYFGSEEVLDAQDRFSELNLTSNYAQTKTVTVKINDAEGKAVQGAKVEFKLYNYADFYPLATLLTDNQGITKFRTGMGDLLVWASLKGKFAFGKLHVPTTDTLQLTLDKNKLEQTTIHYDLAPPKATKELQPLEESAKKHNDRRLTTEDSIRNQYMSTFKDSAWIIAYAKTHQLPADTLLRTIRLSYGNWHEIISYLKDNQINNRHLLFPLTYGVSDKDLSDTKASILTDHLKTVVQSGLSAGIPNELFEKYVLAPRVDLEILSPWRSFLWTKLGSKISAEAQKDIAILTDWMKTNIRVDPIANKHSRASLTPIGVYNLRVADPLSRDIFFVALCRTVGIPARLNPETRTPEYYKETKWLRAGFESQPSQPEMGHLTLKALKGELPPQYSLHFTIARIQDGMAKSLEFEEGRKVADFAPVMPLETGNYLLVTGKRLPDGSVLSSLTGFDITNDKPVTIDVAIRKEATTVKSVGKIDLERIHLTEFGKTTPCTFSDIFGGKSAIVVLLDPDNEPSKHILNDLSPYLKQFNQWSGQFIFVNVQSKGAQKGVFQTYQLPAKSRFTTDTTNELEKVLSGINGNKSSINLPVVLLCQPSGELLLLSVGYKIGMGETLLQLMLQLETNSAVLPISQCTTP